MSEAGTEHLERARGLGPLLAATADDIERGRELPEAIVAALAERGLFRLCLLYTSPSPRDLSTSRMPSSA